MKKANIVVIGAGIIGTSVAYHLAEMGVQDIVMLDKGDLDENDGSTSHAPGGLRVLTANEWFTRLGSASSKMYKKGHAIMLTTGITITSPLHCAELA